MDLTLYNTYSGQKEIFVPVDAEHIRMYVCGPTVYNYAHIGNARPVVVFDTLARLLRKLFPKVTYVRNITDIDDKIISAASEQGKKINFITTRYTNQFHADMAELNDNGPDIEPHATDHITEMIKMVECLIEKNFAYVKEGHVLFSVKKMKDYGKLSSHSPDELIAGARIEVSSYKNSPADFVLWKPSSSEQPGWHSPWGRGRPGWHLECSAMSEKHLGETFDIHGGGQDLIFPHHENEIAQSVCAHSGAPFVNYWMHNGYLTVDGEKMSKSLGNFYTVRQLLDEGWDGETIRLALLKSHYRQPLNFSLRGLQDAKSELDRFYRVLRGHSLAEIINFSSESQHSTIEATLKNDLNTPDAIHQLHGEASRLFRLSNNDQSTLKLKNQFFKDASLLGILQRDPEDWFKGNNKKSNDKIDMVFVEDTIALRNAARARGDFIEADRLRDILSAKNIILEDNVDGTVWKVGEGQK